MKAIVVLDQAPSQIAVGMFNKLSTQRSNRFVLFKIEFFFYLSIVKIYAVFLCSPQVGSINFTEFKKEFKAGDSEEVAKQLITVGETSSVFSVTAPDDVIVGDYSDEVHKGLSERVHRNCGFGQFSLQ